MGTAIEVHSGNGGPPIPVPDTAPAAAVEEVPVYTEMSDSFLSYALSVITSRALPDGRDGLKPVQRRVLWSMLQMGVRDDGPYRKSARIVGDTMGRYHPHGDAAIYDTLVRMGQDFSRMVALVDPQGNFGSLDDPPAASRYTECRLSPAAMSMMAGIDEGTIDMVATYDGDATEPAVLPGALPNLLINGSAGIAVGMATNMVSNNPAEVAAAIELVMASRSKKRPTIDELLAVLPGPDFPSGGIVVNDDGLREAYETGRGRIRIRGRASIEGRRSIIVTELPPNCGPERLVVRITDLMNAEKLPGVTSVADLSDMDGIRLHIGVGPGCSPAAVLADLYRLTPLEDTISVNNVVLVDGVPTTVGLRQLCELYVEHRVEVVVRRTRHRLDAANKRLHLVEGLLIAVDRLDEVIAIIRKAQDAAAARQALIKRFKLTEPQAEHILDMQLRRLTALQQLRLRDEETKLRRDIGLYEQILASTRRQRSVVLGELRTACTDHARDRRTEIVTEAQLAELAPAATPVDAAASATGAGSVIVTLSTTGNIGAGEPPAAGRRQPGRHDLIASAVPARGDDTVYAVTTAGLVRTAQAAALASSTGRARGAPAREVFGCGRGEEVLLVTVGRGDPLMAITAKGQAKRFEQATLTAGKPGESVVDLDRGDRVAAVFAARDGSTTIAVCDDGRAARFASETVATGSLKRGTVAAVRCADKSKVIAAASVRADTQLVTVATSTGGLKATPAGELPVRGRGSGGVLLCRMADDETITAAHIGAGTGELLAVYPHPDDDRREDPRPDRVTVEPTSRGRTPERTPRAARVLAPARW